MTCRYNWPLAIIDNVKRVICFRCPGNLSHVIFVTLHAWNHFLCLFCLLSQPKSKLNSFIAEASVPKDFFNRIAAGCILPTIEDKKFHLLFAPSMISQTAESVRSIRQEFILQHGTSCNPWSQSCLLNVLYLSSSYWL